MLSLKARCACRRFLAAMKKAIETTKNAIDNALHMIRFRCPSSTVKEPGASKMPRKAYPLTSRQTHPRTSVRRYFALDLGKAFITVVR